MHGEHHIFGLLASHWHELTKKHKQPEPPPQTEDLAMSDTEESGEGFDLFLWTKCFHVCQKTHGDSLPCLTMADFNAFLTSHTQNFVETGCGALDLYNDIFGKQNLDVLLSKSQKKETTTVTKEMIINLEPLTLKSMDLGVFLDDSFILRASHAVARFLEKDFPNPLNPAYCATFRKKEAYNAIKYYNNDVDYSCLLTPSFLRKVKSTMNCVEELKIQIYTEGSSLVMQDIKEEVSKTVKNSQSVLSNVNQIIQTIESGNELLETLSTWANYECTLAEVYNLLWKRHENFVKTTPFDKVQKLKDLCDHLCMSSRAIARTVEEFEDIQSDSASFLLSSERKSTSVRSLREKPLVVDISRNSYSSVAADSSDSN